jgi:hypothetical protein
LIGEKVDYFLDRKNHTITIFILGYPWDWDTWHKILRAMWISLYSEASYAPLAVADGNNPFYI